jgi:hypothetical protein
MESEEKRIHHTVTRQRTFSGTPLQINVNGQVADDQQLMNEDDLSKNQPFVNSKTVSTMNGRIAT